ncbi:hypothetical protein LCL95_01625 [Bacillus timonensis]|nr:hypothetical protein [Bacillus timonensis]
MKITKKKVSKMIDSIVVTSNEGEDVSVVNKSNLKFIGKGVHGAVFELSDNVVVKIFGDEDVCAREHYALSLGQGTNLLPKVYCHGPKFIAMEKIEGIDLREYFQSQPLTKEMSAKLIQLLVTFKEIGYQRIDHHKRHIFIQYDGSLRVLDVGTTVWRNRVYPYPRKLLNSLGKQYKNLFLQHVKEMNPDLYEEWRTYIEMEQHAALLHEKYFSKDNVDVKKVRKDSKILSTKSNEWAEKIEDLIYKVHKEQWVKKMVAKDIKPKLVKKAVKEIEAEYENDKNLEEAIEEPSKGTNILKKAIEKCIEKKEKKKKKKRQKKKENETWIQE